MSGRDSVCVCKSYFMNNINVLTCVCVFLSQIFHMLVWLNVHIYGPVCCLLCYGSSLPHTYAHIIVWSSHGRFQHNHCVPSDGDSWWQMCVCDLDLSGVDVWNGI